MRFTREPVPNIKQGKEAFFPFVMVESLPLPRSL